MGVNPWVLAAMEERGYMSTDRSLVNRVAYYLAQSSNDVIDTAEFRRACIHCGVNPDSFTPADLAALQKKLNELT